LASPAVARVDERLPKAAKSRSFMHVR